MIPVFQSLAVLAILLVTLTSCESWKSKENVSSELCSSVVRDTFIGCKDELKYQSSKKKTRSARCCDFAHFRKCIHDYAEGSCEAATNKVVDQLLWQDFGEWMVDCGEYDYNNPTCIYHLWNTWILIALVVFIVIELCVSICLLFWKKHKESLRHRVVQ